MGQRAKLVFGPKGDGVGGLVDPKVTPEILS